MSDSWQVKAVCATLTPQERRPIFGKDADQRAFAGRYCRSCPVRRNCLAEALDNEGGAQARRHGVWGGYSEIERGRLARGRKRSCVDCPEVFVPRSDAQLRCDICIDAYERHRRAVALELARVTRLAQARPLPATVQVEGMQPCGTRAGYARHVAAKETACGPCTEANRTYAREYKQLQRKRVAA